MKNHAWIDFEWQGQKFRYTGQWPAPMKGIIGDVWDTASRSKAHFDSHGDFLIALLAAAGATILEIHSIRPDGSIRPFDFPDFYVN